MHALKKEKNVGKINPQLVIVILFAILQAL